MLFLWDVSLLHVQLSAFSSLDGSGVELLLSVFWEMVKGQVFLILKLSKNQNANLWAPGTLHLPKSVSMATQILEIHSGGGHFLIIQNIPSYFQRVQLHADLQPRKLHSQTNFSLYIMHLDKPKTCSKNYIMHLDKPYQLLFWFKYYCYFMITIKKFILHKAASRETIDIIFVQEN